MNCPDCRHEEMEVQLVCERCGYREYQYKCRAGHLHSGPTFGIARELGRDCDDLMERLKEFRGPASPSLLAQLNFYQVQYFQDRSVQYSGMSKDWSTSFWNQ